MSVTIQIYQPLSQINLYWNSVNDEDEPFKQKDLEIIFLKL